MAKLNYLRLDDFSGGLNELEGSKLADNEATSCRNAVFGQKGVLKKRPGYNLTATINTDPIEGLYLYHKKNGTRNMLATSGTTIWDIDEGAGTATSLKTGLTNADFTFTTLGDICYMSNGKDDVQKYDGSSVTTDTYSHGKYITDHYRHIIISGNDTNPSNVYVYELADSGEETIFEVSTDDGDIITGIAPLQGNLVIFKTNSIYVLYGTDPGNFQLKEVQPNIGCIAPKSIVNIYNKLYFLYRDGVYSFDGFNVKLISDRVQASINEIADASKVVGSWYQQSYLLSHPTGASSENDTILVYNILYEAWSKFTGINASIFNNFDGAQDGKTNLSELYFGDSGTGKIYQYDVGTSDNGNNIDMRYTTKVYDLDRQEIIKTFRKLVVTAISSGSFAVSYDIDKGAKTGVLNIVGFSEDEDALFGKSTWGGTVWNARKITDFGKSLRGGTYGSNISLTFRDNSTNETKIYGVTIQVRARRERFVR